MKTGAQLIAMTQPIQPWMQEAAKEIQKHYRDLNPHDLRMSHAGLKSLVFFIAAHAPAEQTQRITELEEALKRFAAVRTKECSASTALWMRDQAHALIHKGEPS